MNSLLQNTFIPKELIAMCNDGTGQATTLLKITRKRTTKKGVVRYEAYVINGGWNLSFPAETGIATKNGNEYKLVWRGKLPPMLLHINPETGENVRYGGYQEAIYWINDQLKLDSGYISEV